MASEIKVILGFQDVLDIVEQGYTSIGEGVTDAQNDALKYAKKKDCKALFIIHQCVDLTNFEKIYAATTSNGAWEILEKSHGGMEKMKKVKLQTMRRQYDLLQMENHEGIS